MRLVPKPKAKKILFFKVRLAKWVENAESLGVDPATLAELQGLVEAARVAHVEQRRAKQTAEAATATLNNAIARMERLGAGVVKCVRGTAGMAGNAGVLVLASIPPKAKKSRIGPPGEPYGFKQSLGQDGAVTLTWRCKQPRGAQCTAYIVERCNSGSTRGPFRLVAHVGERTIRDATIPPGTPAVVYRIQAMRSTGRGPVAMHTVHLGGGMPDRFSMPTKKLRTTGPGRVAA
jgi:hypothetical protein